MRQPAGYLPRCPTPGPISAKYIQIISKCLASHIFFFSLPPPKVCKVSVTRPKKMYKFRNSGSTWNLKNTRTWARLGWWRWRDRINVDSNWCQQDDSATMDHRYVAHHNWNRYWNFDETDWILIELFGGVEGCCRIIEWGNNNNTWRYDFSRLDLNNINNLNLWQYSNKIHQIKKKSKL